MTPELFTRRLKREQQARKEAETLLERKSAELYEANQQLLRMNQRLELQTRELSCARDAALESSRLKSQFLANMSHEIRTPMNGILGMTELVLNSELTSEQRECLSLAMNSANALLLLINDILDLSKIEAGYLELEAIPFSVARLIEETVQPFALHARGKGLEFSWHADSGLPESMIGDPSRLRQVIVNLVGNAIKFTSQGGVTLRVDCGERTGDCTMLHVAVADTGIGIAKDKQEAIFNAFTQVDGSIARRFGGTGLGLSIVSRLVEKMGGCIWVESEPGKGSTFHFTSRVKMDTSAAGRAAPGRNASLENPQPTCEPNGPALSILVAEDNPVNQRVAECLLRRHGHNVVLVDDGRKAVEAFVSQPFDIVLMDVQMPEMDGYEATAAIRQEEKEQRARRTPIVALTAHAMKGDVERCLAAGMDDYVAKPINFAELLRKMSGLCSEARNTIDPIPAEPSRFA